MINKFKILISFGHPERGKSLLRLADGLIKKRNDNARITVMHLSPSNELHHYNEAEYEKESFAPVLQESKELNQKIDTLFKISNNIDADITDEANKGDYDLLLIGVGQSIFEGSLLGKVLGFINPDKIINQVTGKENLFEDSPFDERTKTILGRSKVPVGVLVDKGLTELKNIFIPIFSDEDTFLIQYAQKLINNSGAQLTILDALGEVKNNPDFKESIRAIEQTAPNHIHLLSEKIINKDYLRNQNLMLVSLQSWKKLVETKSLWLVDIPSSLILTED